ncbi:MAG: Zn-dependent alcohol dehydrogenase [Rhodovibrionaceae bacterium]
MKAAVCRAFGEALTIEDLELAPPQAGEVRVRIAACAICHSDLTAAAGGWGGVLPAVYGHEAAGVVEELGPGVHDLQLGDHVVVTLIRACGHCHYCNQGKLVCCEGHFHLDGHSPLSTGDGGTVTQGIATGAFAEAVVVDRSQVVAIPKDIPFDAASLLACGVITGLGAVVNTARVPAGASVAVIGAGGVGLNAVQGAVLSGANPIVAIDVKQEKLEAAKRFGATHGFLAARGDLAGDIKAVTQGRGVDYAFVTVGAKPAFDSSYGLLAKGGMAVLVGMPHSGVESAFEVSGFAYDSKAILGSRMGSARIGVDIPYLVELYRQGRLKLDELISGRFPLERINEAIAEVQAGTVLRNVIVFDA